MTCSILTKQTGRHIRLREEKQNYIWEWGRINHRATTEPRNHLQHYHDITTMPPWFKKIWEFVTKYFYGMHIWSWFPDHPRFSRIFTLLIYSVLQASIKIPVDQSIIVDDSGAFFLFCFDCFQLPGVHIPGFTDYSYIQIILLWQQISSHNAWLFTIAHRAHSICIIKSRAALENPGFDEKQWHFEIFIPSDCWIILLHSDTQQSGKWRLLLPLIC